MRRRLGYAWLAGAAVILGCAGGEWTATNDAPVAGDDAVSAVEETPKLITVSDLLVNDSDADGDLLTAASFTQPADGTVVDNGNGTWTYTPAAGFVGVDSFTYTVSDGYGGTDTANVAVTVSAETDLLSGVVTTNTNQQGQVLRLIFAETEGRGRTYETSITLDAAGQALAFAADVGFPIAPAESYLVVLEWVSGAAVVLNGVEMEGVVLVAPADGVRLGDGTGATNAAVSATFSPAGGLDLGPVVTDYAPADFAGDAAANLLVGSTGTEIVAGGDGNDSVFGRAGTDDLSGDAGDDLVRGGDGADALYGGAGQDLLYGDGGADLLYGGGGDDVIFGMPDDSVVDGGLGVDAFALSDFSGAVETLDLTSGGPAIAGVELFDMTDSDALDLLTVDAAEVASLGATNAAATMTADPAIDVFVRGDAGDAVFLDDATWTATGGSVSYGGVTFDLYDDGTGSRIAIQQGLTVSIAN